VTTPPSPRTPASAVSVSSPQVDGELTEAFAVIVEMDAAIEALHKQYGDDADSRDDYLECQDKRYDAIDTLIDVPASSKAGIKAKATALQMDQFG